MKNIAIIPARSGSKGLKDKNIKLLNGKPMLAYSIEAAKNTGLFDEIFVSTDSELYADISKEYGAIVPFLRGKELSSDTASSWDVVKDVLIKYEKLGITFNTVVLLQPTSPLRTSQDIMKAYSLMEKKQANAVVSICEVDHSPLWCNTIPEDGSLVNFISREIVMKSRQKLETYYRINGALYVVKTDYLFNAETIYDSECYAYVMTKRESIDIDDQLDFDIAEIIMNRANTTV
jgi:CMP-N,N'-diacetyllegionaminic acid synthase